VTEQLPEVVATANEHSIHSSYREMLLEHLLAGEMMRHLWLHGIRRMEMLKPQVDDGGYDLIAEVDGVLRHIQLKATFHGSTIRRFNINTALCAKPSGCVIVVQFNPDTLELGPFRWFGAEPMSPLPSLDAFPIARHTKGNAQGVKTNRPNIRTLPWSAFEEIGSVGELIERLFGV
jgi:hypothetical protein